MTGPAEGSGAATAPAVAAAPPLSGQHRPRCMWAPATAAGLRLAVVIQVCALGAPLSATYFSAVPAALAAAHPALAACAPSTLPVLLPRLLAASALPLLLGVVGVGNGRFLFAINPMTTPAADWVLSRYLSNTLEQYVLHAAAVAGLAAWGRCAAAAAAVPWFMLGRALFLLGYLLHPIYRGAGFSMTALPTAVALGFCARQLAVHGLTAGL